MDRGYGSPVGLGYGSGLYILTCSHIDIDIDIDRDIDIEIDRDIDRDIDIDEKYR